MAQFDLYRNADGKGFLLDVQSDLLDRLQSRVVAPLISVARFSTPIRHVNPVFIIDGTQFVMVAEFLGSVPVGELGDVKGNLAHRRDEIVRALVTLLNGV